MVSNLQTLIHQLEMLAGEVQRRYRAETRGEQ
jgi:hypothetical protein